MTQGGEGVGKGGLDGALAVNGTAESVNATKRGNQLTSSFLTYQLLPGAFGGAKTTVQMEREGAVRREETKRGKEWEKAALMEPLPSTGLPSVDDTTKKGLQAQLENQNQTGRSTASPSLMRRSLR